MEYAVFADEEEIMARAQCTQVGTLRVLSGTVRSDGVWSGRQKIGTLPVDCRPAVNLRFSVSNDQSAHLIEVQPDGDIMWVEGAKTSNMLSLAGVAFAVAEVEPKHAVSLTTNPFGRTVAWESARPTQPIVSRQTNEALCLLHGSMRPRSNELALYAGKLKRTPQNPNPEVKLTIGSVPEFCRPQHDWAYVALDVVSGQRVVLEVTNEGSIVLTSRLQSLIKRPNPIVQLDGLFWVPSAQALRSSPPRPPRHRASNAA